MFAVAKKSSRVEPREHALVPTSDLSGVGAGAFCDLYIPAPLACNYGRRREFHENELSKHDLDAAAILGRAKLHSRTAL
ncbi:hypothetical protein D3C84_1157350 [compost metagenome]